MIYTIGHSTRSVSELVALLQSHGIQQVADIRRVPRSARHPQFVKEALGGSLAAQGIAYRHFEELGGRRHARRASVNTALRNESLRGYADHMQTDAFRSALLDLLHFSEEGATTVLCAEAVWWACHRELLADVLLVRGVPVRHILSSADAKPHQLSEFARETAEGVTYPGLL